MDRPEEIQSDAVAFKPLYGGQSEGDDHMMDDDNITYPDIQSTLGGDDDYYRMEGLKLAVLINMKTFVGKSVRIGSEKDMDSLKEVFPLLGFEVRLLEDNHRDDLMRALDRIASTNFTKYACLVVVMMSHGGDDFLLSVNEEKFTLSEVEAKFLPDKCPTLTGKPKLFFIQACRGESIIESYMARDERRENDESVSVYRIPKTCDVLEFFSTEKGNLSAREDGTWFIQCLANRLNRMRHNETLMNILTFVVDDVARKKEGKKDGEVFKQQPVLISRLRKLIKF